MQQLLGHWQWLALGHVQGAENLPLSLYVGTSIRHHCILSCSEPLLGCLKQLVEQLTVLVSKQTIIKLQAMMVLGTQTAG
jgi:hypothetical protein